MWFIPKSHPEINNRVLLISMVLVAVALWLGNGYSVTLADGKTAYGVFSLLPIACVLGFALVSRRTLEPLFFGAMVGLMLINPNPKVLIESLMASSLKVMAGPVMGWILLLCVLMGGLIMWLQKSGATDAFSRLIGRVARTRSHSLIAAWLLGLLIFIDDYLSSLTVGATMRRLTDRLGVSRAMLSYVADATAAPVCLLVPISTWGIYLAGLLESNHVAEAGSGMAYYMQVIPYVLYAWVAILVVPLVAFDILKPGAAMRQAEARAAERRDQGLAEQAPVEESYGGRSHIMYFLLPIVVLVLGTWWFGDTLLGAMAAVLFTAALYRFLQLAGLPQLFNDFMEGMLSMVTPVAIIFAAFVLQDVNEQLGLAPWLIENVKPYLNAQWLPVITFVLLSALTFTTGSFWGIYAIAFPIIVPLAVALDANLPLTLGALISAGGFGSQACFFGDSTVLSARSCEITPMEHALTQWRYVWVSALIAAVLFALGGWLWG
ncbi:Na+/H+ antiporter NhaC family protein [Neisseria shayeganii]|uniref:Sodium:proton antiporter n=1 Tax=Neisseria shayeganii TaxID=607712 RepID=A0A7D7S4Y8_9NEIS|nr:Na+/H+ antiporter NhaC family protein [Neisseria shayeganii]QMT40426.1 sodium:proton antiporter [Neisseria shayeganii]